MKACDDAVNSLSQRMSHRWLMPTLGPQQGTHPLMGDDFLHLETVLHLTEQALQYLFMQKFLRNFPSFSKMSARLNSS